MFVTLSNGQIINLAHVSCFHAFNEGDRVLRYDTPSGLTRVAGGCIEADYEAVKAATKAYNQVLTKDIQQHDDNGDQKPARGRKPHLAAVG